MHLIVQLLSKELKNDFEILVGQVVFLVMLVMDQNSQNVVWINNSRNCLNYLNFDAIFELLGKFTVRLHILFFNKVLIILR